MHMHDFMAYSFSLMVIRSMCLSLDLCCIRIARHNQTYDIHLNVKCEMVNGYNLFLCSILCGIVTHLCVPYNLSQ